MFVVLPISVLIFASVVFRKKNVKSNSIDDSTQQAFSTAPIPIKADAVEAWFNPR